MGGALCSRLSSRKPPASPSFLTCLSEPFGAVFWRHTPVSLRFWPLRFLVMAAHARPPWFLALIVPDSVKKSACMFWGTLGAPGSVYSQANRAPSRGSRGAASVPKTTFSLVTPPDLLPLSWRPSTSVVPTFVSLIALIEAFPVSRCSFRVHLIRHVSWRVSQYPSW